MRLKEGFMSEIRPEAENVGKQEASTEAKWYVLHTYSGYEKKVKDNIIKQVDNRGMRELIEEVLVPVEITDVPVETKATKESKESKAPKKRRKSAEQDEPEQEPKQKVKKVESKLFPCYVYVKMVMTDETWYICRNTRGVTGFVGPGSKPIPLTDEEVRNLGVSAYSETSKFKTGDLVRLKSGPLAGEEGVVDSVDLTERTMVLTVMMLGRPTPATVSLDDVESVL